MQQNNISQTYLSTLGKVVLDERRGLLYDSNLRVENLNFNLTLASFSPIVAFDIVLSTEIIVGDPIDGSCPLTNHALVNGNIVLFKRGKVSFARKAMQAQASNACAVIIAQTEDIWPFVATDLSNELPVGFLKIPVFTMSLSDSNIIFHTENISKLQNKKLIAEIRLSQPTNFQCCICHEDMCSGQEILKLRCRHEFHSCCVQLWLETRSTCPMCRFEMPSAADQRVGEQQKIFDTSNYFA
jgi:hypothetical protein